MMQKKRQLIAGIVVALIVCAGVVVVNLRVVRVAYHEWQMERAHRAYLAGPTTASGAIDVSVEAEEDYERHRQALVDLGAIVEHHYDLQHLRTRTEESKDFSRRLLSGDCPEHVDFEAPYPYESEPMQLTVWCKLAAASEWDEFIAKHDVADYRERFMDIPSGLGVPTNERDGERSPPNG